MTSAPLNEDTCLIALDSPSYSDGITGDAEAQCWRGNKPVGGNCPVLGSSARDHARGG